MSGLTIITPALAAAWRLRSTLPVVSHAAEERLSQRDQRRRAKRSQKEIAALAISRRESIRAWMALPEAQRPTRSQMGEQLGITRAAVSAHVRYLRIGKYHASR